MANEKNVYLELEASTGKLYEYSKTEADGFVKHVSTKNVITYRRYHEEGIFGNLRGVSIRETNFGDKLSVFLDNPETGKNYFLSFPLFDMKKDIATFSMDVIRYLPALTANSPYRIFPYVIDADPTKTNSRKRYGVSIKIARLSDNAVDDVNKIPMLTYEYIKRDGNGGEELIAGDVPKTDWVEGLKGTPEPDNKLRNKYLYKVLQDNLIEFEGGSSSKKTFNSAEAQTAPAQQAKPVTQTATTVAKETPKGGMIPNTGFDAQIQDAEIIEDEDEDQLPF